MRDVLVAVCGLTPQVVTETLWALHHRTPPIDPAEIWILTTQAGQSICRDRLLGPHGALARYVREYRPTPAPRCTPSSIQIFRDARGAPLSDVRSEADNRAVGDQIAAFLRRHSSRPETRLHCSVAGGRKTMGVLLAAALQMYGRPTDRLYHVLVPPEFEAHAAFFYPPKRSRRLVLPDGRRIDARSATVELAEVPYVPLRGLLSRAQLDSVASLSDLASAAQARLRVLVDPPEVRLHLRENTLRIGPRRIALPPTLMALYRAFARTKLRHCTRPELRTCGDCMDCFLPFTKETWEQTKAILEERGGKALLPNIEQGKSDADQFALGQFRSLVRKVNRKLEEAIHVTQEDNPYRIRSGGTRGDTVYGLVIDKTKLSEG